MSNSGGHKYGPILSPMEEDFKPGGGHKADTSTVVDGLPGYPKGTKDIIDQVTLDTGGNFGKVKPTKE